MHQARKAALGMDDLASDPGRLITGQKHHEPRRVLGLPDPPRRELRCDLALQLLGHPARVRGTRIDGVHRDPLVPDLCGECPGERLDSALAGGVGELSGIGPSDLPELKLTILPPGLPGLPPAKPYAKERHGPHVDGVVRPAPLRRASRSRRGWKAAAVTRIEGLLAYPRSRREGVARNRTWRGLSLSLCPNAGGAQPRATPPGSSSSDAQGISRS